jgi:uncharacterized protein (TIGR03067 family)
MRTIPLLLATVVFMTALSQGQSQDKKDDKKEEKKDKKDDKKTVEIKKDPTVLEGTWSVESIEYDGKTADMKKIKDMQFVFQGNQLTVKKGKKVTGQGTFTLDPKAKPATIDYEEGKEIFSPYDTGIFEVKGSNLKLCTTADRKKRPTAFDSKQGQVIVLKKAKK